MDNAKPISNPMSTSEKLTEDPKGIPVDTKKYRGMIGEDGELMEDEAAVKKVDACDSNSQNSEVDSVRD
ncbi:hypothetical protein AgCh_025623 [Apium graveolens]